MLVKQGVPEDVYGMVLRRLSDMAKAGLLESQYPGVMAHSSAARLETDAVRSRGHRSRPRYTLPDGQRAARPLKGMSGEPKSLWNVRR
jgi:hypothetical protein